MPTVKPLQPEDAIDSWRLWDGDLQSRPEFLRFLSGGLSNRSLLLRSGDHKMVLRLNGAGYLLPGASRDNEFKTWQAASNQGIAPRLLHVDKSSRFLVSTYIDNDLPSKPPFKQPFVNQAIDLLERCHQLHTNLPSIDYPGHIDQYWKIIGSRQHAPDPALIEQRDPMQYLLETLVTANPATGLCHHDPVIENFVGTAEKLYLIDWEYAATGFQVLDYAALATEWAIDDKTIMDRAPVDPDQLATAKTIYQYLCSLWQAAAI